MKKLVLGGYSYHLISNGGVFENIFDTQLTPVLKYLYENERCKISLSLSSSELDWVVENRPEIAKLMSILLKRGSITLLSSTLYQSFLPVASAGEVADELELMRLKIRQYFHYKSSGFFAFDGIWQTELLRPLSKEDMTYALIPIENLEALSTFTKPFVMQEHGKKIMIIPTSAEVKSLESEYFECKGDISKFKAKLSKRIKYTSSPECADYDVLFFNIDDFVRCGSDFSLFAISILECYDSVQSESMTSDECSSDDVYYMSSGCYGSNRRFLEDLYLKPENVMRIARINYVENLFASKLCKKKMSSQSNQLNLMRIYSGLQFVDDYSSEMLNREIYKGYILSLKELTEGCSALPAFDMFNYKLDVFKNKNNLFLLDTRCASIREIGDFKTGVNLISSGRLFEDVVRVHLPSALKNHGSAYHSYNQFELSEFKQMRSGGVYEYKSADFCSLGLSIDKVVTVRNSKEIDLSIRITNANQFPMDFTYSLFCSFGNIKDTSTLEECNTIFNVYLENDKKKSITFTSEPGFVLTESEKNSLLPSWEVSIATGESYKIDFKMTF